MLGELFTPIETPEAQNRGFLKGFFGGNAHTFDREELCVSFYLLFNYNVYMEINNQMIVFILDRTVIQLRLDAHFVFWFESYSKCSEKGVTLRLIYLM